MSWILILLLIGLLIAYELLGEYGGQLDKKMRYRRWIIVVISFLLIIFIFVIARQINTVMKGH